MDGIPPLIELLRSDYPEVQRNACGALKNLSYGRTKSGLDNKVRLCVVYNLGDAWKIK